MYNESILMINREAMNDQMIIKGTSKHNDHSLSYSTLVINYSHLWLLNLLHKTLFISFRLITY